MTQVKICGVTRPEDVEGACGFGASYLGFNFAAVSPRRVTLETARRLAAASAPGVLRVGVFVGESYEEIVAAIAAGRLDLIQLHRPLREEDFEKVPRPVICVARVHGGAKEVPEPALLARCRALLFDTAAPTSLSSAARSGLLGKQAAPGGTGARFDWGVVEGKKWPVPLFLAGGLNAGNVAEAIRRARPAAVDVASGVESEPGIKDTERMRKFFEAVRRADEEQG